MPKPPLPFLAGRNLEPAGEILSTLVEMYIEPACSLEREILRVLRILRMCGFFYLAISRNYY